VEKLKHIFAAINNNIMYRQLSALRYFIVESFLTFYLYQVYRQIIKLFIKLKQ